jgi:hypothetical protein
MLLSKNKNADLIRVFTGQADEPEPRPEGVVDFDGGARETPPPTPDPEADHNAFVSALFRQLPSGGGGLW